MLGSPCGLIPVQAQAGRDKKLLLRDCSLPVLASGRGSHPARAYTAYTLKPSSSFLLFGALLSREAKDSSGSGAGVAPSPEIRTIQQMRSS